MDQMGYVKSIEDDIAVVEVKRVSSCGDKCGSCQGGCSIPSMKVKVKNTLGVTDGDMVELRVSTKNVLQSAFIAYVIPLVMMIVGIGLGVYLFKDLGIENYEVFGFFLGIVFLAVSFFILKAIDKRTKDTNKITFEMIKAIK